MGARVSSQAEEISFHPVVKGHHISLDGCMHRAERYKSFNHGLLFSNRPLYYREKIWVKVIQDEPHWHGALRLGFTSVDPDTIDPSRLPPFSCPDLNRRNGFWAVAIPEDLCYQNNLISFWVNRKGQALYQAMGDSCPSVLFAGLPRNGLLWAMIDVYGQTKAIQLLNYRWGKVPEPCDCQPNKVSNLLTAVSNRCNRTSDTSDSIRLCTEDSSLVLQLRNLDVCFLEDEPFCTICQESLSGSQFLVHSFCKSCLEDESALCPLCQQEIECIET